MGKKKKKKVPGKGKLYAAGVSGSVLTIWTFVLTLVGVEVPPEVSAAVVTLVGAAFVYFTES